MDLCVCKAFESENVARLPVLPTSRRVSDINLELRHTAARQMCEFWYCGRSTVFLRSPVVRLFTRPQGQVRDHTDHKTQLHKDCQSARLQQRTPSTLEVCGITSLTTMESQADTAELFILLLARDTLGKVLHWDSCCITKIWHELVYPLKTLQFHLVRKIQALTKSWNLSFFKVSCGRKMQ